MDCAFWYLKMGEKNEKMVEMGFYEKWGRVGKMVEMGVIGMATAVRRWFGGDGNVGWWFGGLRCAGDERIVGEKGYGSGGEWGG
jgi:hypothetical protein